MDKLNLTKHISSSFNEEIDEVRNHVMAMGGLIEQQLNNALAAIATADAELAQKVIDTDLKVNDWELQIDRECTSIIVKRQPAASDLRLIMAIMLCLVIYGFRKMVIEFLLVGKMYLKLQKSKNKI